jgi:rfaE bifunctional protein kinase chain/domain
VHVQRTEKRLGGAANVALNVKALGAQPILCAVTGNDAEGQEFMRLLRENDMTQDGILCCSGRPTTVKHRILSGSQQMIRVDSEVDHVISNEEKDAFLDKISRLLPACDVLIFEDYDKGLLDEKVISEIIRMATKYGVPTVVDPKKRNFLHYHQATLFKPNLKELREGLKIDLDPRQTSDLEKAVNQLKKKLDLKAVLVTLSERGVFIDFEGQKHLVPAHVRQIADVSGAGDTVVSIAALCLALKMPPPLLAGLANLGGGLVCEHAGVVPVNKHELFREAAENPAFERYLKQKV